MKTIFIYPLKLGILRIHELSCHREFRLASLQSNYLTAKFEFLNSNVYFQGIYILLEHERHYLDVWWAFVRTKKYFQAVPIILRYNTWEKCDRLKVGKFCETYGDVSALRTFHPSQVPQPRGFRAPNTLRSNPPFLSFVHLISSRGGNGWAAIRARLPVGWR